MTDGSCCFPCIPLSFAKPKQKQINANQSLGPFFQVGAWWWLILISQGHSTFSPLSLLDTLLSLMINCNFHPHSVSVGFHLSQLWAWTSIGLWYQELVWLIVQHPLLQYQGFKVFWRDSFAVQGITEPHSCKPTAMWLPFLWIHRTSHQQKSQGTF